MPRFVLLEHKWNGTHQDLMLEHQGSLRTWALEAPIGPAVQVLARELPDHRLVYLEYEGPIADDRGEVRRLDQGSYEALEWSDNLVMARIQGERLRGLLVCSRVPQEAGREAAAATGWTVRLGEGNLD